MNVTSAQQLALERALRHSLDYLDHLDDAPVDASASLAELRARLDRPLADEGVDPGQVIDDLAADTAGGLVNSTGGRFFGWVIGGALPAAVAADWLATAWDQNAGLYAASPAEAVIEEVCGAWLKDLLGLPASASFAFVTGCQMAHATCLAAARHAILERHGWDVERDGLGGAPRIRILTSGERHGSIARAVRLLGLGTGSVVDLPADAEGRLQPQTLERALLEQPGAPTIVLLQAGDLNIGAYDPFAELIPLAHAHDAWVHVDGAFGLWVAASPRLRHLVAGVERADSWATDGHKMLNVQQDCGYAIVAHPDAHRGAMSHRASYLVHASDARDQMDWNPEWSRRGRGVATYAALRELGRQGLADLVERCSDHARALVTRIGALPGAEVVWVSEINQGLVRFVDPRPGSTAEDHDRHTDAVMEAVRATGEAFFTGTTWRGTRCMRVSVSSWRTSASDVDRSVTAFAQVLSG